MIYVSNNILLFVFFSNFFWVEYFGPHSRHSKNASTLSDHIVPFVIFLSFFSSFRSHFWKSGLVIFNEFLNLSNVNEYVFALKATNSFVVIVFGVSILHFPLTFLVLQLYNGLSFGKSLKPNAFVSCCCFPKTSTKSTFLIHNTNASQSKYCN